MPHRAMKVRRSTGLVFHLSQGIDPISLVSFSCGYILVIKANCTNGTCFQKIQNVDVSSSKDPIDNLVIGTPTIDESFFMFTFNLEFNDQYFDPPF